MKHGDNIKLRINGGFVEATFQGWEDNSTIAYKRGREEYVTHYNSVVEINGKEL